jgi:hypothetical protein
MASGDGKAPVGAAITAGVDFARANLAAVAPAAALVLAANLLAGALFGGNVAPVLVTSILVGISYQAFLLRLAVRGDRSGLLGLKLGGDELRLLGVMGATFLPLLLLVIGGAIVLTSAATITASQSGIDLSKVTDRAEMDALMQAELSGPHGVFIWTIFGVLFAAALYVVARLSIAPPATIGEGRMLAYSTFPWTRGNALRIIAALAPFAILSGLASLILSSAASLGPLGIVLQVAVTFVVSVALAPAQAGVTAFLYRGFRPPELGAPPAR